MTYDHLLSDISPLPRQAAFLADFLLAKKVDGCSPSTLRWYSEAFKDLDRFCHRVGESFDPAHATPTLIRTWVATLQDRDLAKGTVNNRFRALRAYLNWCVREGIIAKSPMTNMRTPGVGKNLVPIFTEEHVKGLLYLCPPNMWWGARDRAILLTLLHTGIRLSELTGLKMCHIDLVNDSIRVRGKGDKERTIFLDPEAERALLQYLRRRSDQQREEVWLSCHGTPLTTNAVQQLIRDLGKRSGINGVRCSAHTFRHTFAVNFLKSGGSVRHLQEIMGHTSMKPLEVYLRTVNADDAMQVHRQVRPFKTWKL